VRIERWLDVVRLRMRSLSSRDLVDRELDDELAYHLERLVEHHVGKGLTPTDAKRTALAEMSGVQQKKEECQDMRRVRLVEDFFEDARYAARHFTKQPGFTAVVLIVLALAIGGNAAIFSVAKSVLAPLAIPRADRVVMVWTDAPARNWHRFPASMPDVRDWQASGVFASLGAFLEDGFNVRLSDRTERVEGLRATAGFFDALAVPAVRGRTFHSGDDPADHAALLSDRAWQSLFARNSDVVGRAIVIDGELHTIIGVLAPNAPRLGKEEIYVLLPASIQASAERGSRNLAVIARLRDGLSFEAAGERMAEVSLDLAKRYPQEDGGLSASLQRIQEAYVQDAQLLLGVLIGAVACVLAVACANIASLLLAKGLTRGRELAIRTALGGGRWRLTRQLLTEHVLLAIIGGAASIVPAWWGMRFVASFGLEELPNADLSGLNAPVLLFTFVVALVTGVLCGILPASLVWRRDVSATLKSGPNVDAGRTSHRVRSSFVVGQVAVTAVLLVVGGLALRSFLHVVADSPGYNPSNVLTLRVALSDVHYRTPQQQSEFFERVLARSHSLPGVVAAAAARELPTSDDVHGSGLIFPGQPEPRVEDIPIALYTSVLGDYFRTMQVPLVAGRGFEQRDSNDAMPVAIVDEWTAHKYWPGQNVVGQRFKMGRTQPWREVVGVAGNVEAPAIVRFLKGRIGQVYLPFGQDPHPRMTLVVRGAGDPMALVADMRSTVRDLDPDQPVFGVQTLDDVRSGGRSLVRLVTTVLSAFALMALLLAVVGLYGTVAYDVGARTREFGLRLSLGAPPSSILSMVLRGGGLLLAIGVGLGFLGAIAVVQLVASLLYGVQARDPLTFAIVALLLAVSGLVAIYVPARRATAIDPVIALRCD
jgi:putative ABC transport system permease protein